jgi:hypothetical protein
VRPPSTTRRYAIVHDIDGPRIRLGLLWFAVEVAAIVVGLVGLAILFGVVVAIAASQTAMAWRARGFRPSREVASLSAAGLVIAGALDTAALGAACVATGAVAVVAGVLRRGASPRALVDAGFTVQSCLFVGLAGASVVVTARFGYSAAVALVLVAAAYEVGDYIVGSGASNRFEGPIAGFASVMVVTTCVTVLGVQPFEFPDAFVYGALAGLACPLGQLAASAVLPTSTAKASALRRVDTLIVLGPGWALVAGHLLR